MGTNKTLTHQATALTSKHWKTGSCSFQGSSVTMVTCYIEPDSIEVNLHQPSSQVCVLLTEVVNQEVRGEALGAVAHGGVVVRVSSKHQHGPTHNHGRVEVAEEAAVPENGPAHARAHTHTHTHTHTVMTRYWSAPPGGHYLYMRQTIIVHIGAI